MTMKETESKRKYRAHCASNLDIPLFSKDWWLDAAVGAENWDVAIVEENGRLVASMPYAFSKHGPFFQIYQPPLTQCLGPWVTSALLGKERELRLHRSLIDQLPAYDKFQQSWNFQNQNWLAFHWSGFKQTTRYTYRIEDISDTKQVWQGFKDSVKGDCKKAERRFGVQVHETESTSEFIQLHSMVFSRKSLKRGYSDALINRIDNACGKRNARKIFIARDAEGRSHAAAYIVFDSKCAYYLLSGSDPDLRSSGALSLCLWKAIQESATRVRSFDFEGSMIENVARSFRAFGGEQTPYFFLSDFPSISYRILEFIKQEVRNASKRR